MGLSVEKSEQSPEMERFRDALREVLQVSKSDLKLMLAKDKADKAGKPKRGPKRVTNSSKS
jgi:hypothetical protein